jgi:hypothetical protein
MATTKYGQYVIRHPINYKGDWGPEVWYKGESDYKTDFTLLFIQVNRDMVMEEYSHVHDFDMYVWLLPLDPKNMDDLGAEVSMDFGKELERHVITQSSSIYVPKGVVHGPFIFKNVTKPILFVHTMMAPKYYKTETFK